MYSRLLTPHSSLLPLAPTPWQTNPSSRPESPLPRVVRDPRLRLRDPPPAVVAAAKRRMSFSGDSTCCDGISHTRTSSVGVMAASATGGATPSMLWDMITVSLRARTEGRACVCVSFGLASIRKFLDSALVQPVHFEVLLQEL